MKIKHITQEAFKKLPIGAVVMDVHDDITYIEVKHSDVATTCVAEIDFGIQHNKTDTEFEFIPILLGETSYCMIGNPSCCYMLAPKWISKMFEVI